MRDQAERLRLLARALRDQVRLQIREGVHSCRILAVTSGKGGVGKTNLALGISLSLARAGYRVVLLDADLGLANVDVVLGILPRYNLAHFFEGKKTLEEVIYEGPAGLKIIPGGSGIAELANLDVPSLEKVFREFSLLDNKLDFMIIDTSAGISRQVLAFVLAADEVLVVTTPEPTGLIKVYTNSGGKGKVRVVVNMVKDLREGELAAQKLLGVVNQFLGIEVEVAGFIPRDAAVSEAVRRHQAYVLAFPRAPASVSTARLAALLGGFPEERPRGARLFFEQVTAFLRGQQPWNGGGAVRGRRTS